MFSHIHSSSIVVADQDAAIDFYVNTLGWQKGMDNMFGPDMRWVTVVPPGATTELVLSHPSWYTEGGATRQPGGHTGVSLVAPDIDATYATLVARGVTFRQPVETMPWGQKATWFSDPDGNEFFLVNE